MGKEFLSRNRRGWEWMNAGQSWWERIVPFFQPQLATQLQLMMFDCPKERNYGISTFWRQDNELSRRRAGCCSSSGVSIGHDVRHCGGSRLPHGIYCRPGVPICRIVHCASAVRAFNVPADHKGILSCRCEVSRTGGGGRDQCDAHSLVDDKSSAGSYEFCSSELRSFVAQKDNVTIKNAKTGRVLAWRREGVEDFLVEAPEAEIGQTSVFQPFFQFSQDKDAQLPCPRVLFVRCEAYKILVYGSAPAVGLTAYVKANVTYLTLGAENLVTFFVGVARSSAESSSMV